MLDVEVVLVTDFFNRSFHILLLPPPQTYPASGSSKLLSQKLIFFDEKIRRGVDCCSVYISFVLVVGSSDIFVFFQVLWC